MTLQRIREARALAAEALTGQRNMATASALLHGSLPSTKMTHARRVAGSDWPEVEDTVSLILCYGTPADWGDLLERLVTRGTRAAFWWLDAHGEHPAGIAFVVHDPSEALALRCLAGGMVGERWTAENAPNETLRKRLVPNATTYVWYPPDFDALFAAVGKKS